MTIRDRGNIKWTSLMLPEHVKELRRYIHEEYYDIPEPIIDAQQMEAMNEICNGGNGISDSIIVCFISTQKASDN